MKLEQSFDVEAPVDAVWSALIDVQRFAPCLPGAEITEAGEDGTYRGTFQVKLGPTTAAYNGVLKLAEVDEAAHRAVMAASGTDKRGQGGAKATIVSVVRERDGRGATVDVETDFTITGRLARFGRGGMIQDVSNRLLRDFSACLQQAIAAAQPPAAAAAQAAGGGGDSTAAAAGGGAGHAVPPPPPPQAKPVRGFSLLLSVFWERVRRLFRRGA